MKKLILFSLLSILISGSCWAQKETVMAKKEVRKEKKEERRNEVNYVSKQSFGTDFPNAQGAWLRKDNMDEVSFTLNNRNLIAYYDDGGMLIGTSEMKTIKDLPTKAQDFIKSNYSDYDIMNVLFFNDSELNDQEMFMYGTQLDGSDNYFVELKRGTKTIVLQVTPDGDSKYFAEFK
ncbi:MAG: hypothetical protein ABIP68_05580 [Ferruginibacter sp.]